MKHTHSTNQSTRPKERTLLYYIIEYTLYYIYYTLQTFCTVYFCASIFLVASYQNGQPYTHHRIILRSIKCSTLESCEQVTLRPGANYVKTHPEFGEVFPDWRLFEGARGCHQVLVTKRGQSFFDNMWDEFGQTVDFMHGRLANTVVLQCMQHVATSIIQTIYDGMSESDVNLLLMECLRLCVSRMYRVRFVCSVFFSFSELRPYASYNDDYY